MTTAKWREIPPQEISIHDICPSQGYVSISVLRDILIGRYREPYGKDIYPHVVKENNIFWLEDGHHRYIIDLIQGEKLIKVRILNNDRE